MGLYVETVLPTPTGWIKVKDLKPGHVLYGETGYQCTVTSVSDTYMSDTFLLGIGWCNRVTVAPDATLEILYTTPDQEIDTVSYRSMEHLHQKIKEKIDPEGGLPRGWVNLEESEIGHKYFHTKRVDELFGDVKFRRKAANPGLLKWKVPIAFPLENKPQDFYIDPWIMGVLLNYFRNGELILTLGTMPFFLDSFAKRGLHLTPPENPGRVPTKYIRFDLPDDYVQYLEHIGFIEGVIPDIYLLGSVQQRTDLLAGIMDQYSERFRTRVRNTDARYVTFDTRQRRKMLQLLRSLGYPAIFNTEVRKQAIKWYPNVVPFTMPKLKIRYEYMTFDTRTRIRKIVWDISKVLEDVPRPVRDICVDSPSGLYVAGRGFVPLRSDSD